MRGFAAIGLHMAKDPKNIGQVLRAAGCYGAAMVACSGSRYRRSCTDTQAAHRHLPLIECGSLEDVRPFGAMCVAVDLLDDAEPLQTFKHPSAAFYVFGPEDGTLGPDVLKWCSHRVYVPTRRCMNLGATVNVMLYDRLAKLGGEG